MKKGLTQLPKATQTPQVTHSATSATSATSASPRETKCIGNINHDK